VYQCHFLAEKPITVGWGKKETQFHGSEGKPTAATLQQVVSSSLSKVENNFEFLP